MSPEADLAWVEALCKALTHDVAQVDTSIDGQLLRDVLLAPSFTDVVSDATSASSLAHLLTCWLKDLGPDGARAVFCLTAYAPAEVVRQVVPAHEGWPHTVVAALFDAVSGLTEHESVPGVDGRGQRAAAPLLARSQFLISLVPLREQQWGALQPRDHESAGSAPGGSLVRARRARDDWVGYLDAYERTSLLTEQLGRHGVEREVRLLLHEPLEVPDGDECDHAVWEHLMERHLLPRFAVGSSVATTWKILGKASRSFMVTSAVAFAIALALVAFAVAGYDAIGAHAAITVAGIAAAAGYLAIFGASLQNRAATWPWLLRLPAASAVGLLALASFTTSWWRDDGESDRSATWLAAAALTAGAVGYLLIEARNHNVEPGPVVLRRVLTVAGIGAIHALLVSLLALRAVIPVLTDVVAGDATHPGAALAGWWQHGGHPGVLPPGTLLAFAAAWSFAAGVFAQVLWEDRPVTAPLGHLEWRSRT